MKYIIMADGAETRWKRHLGIHKWEININGETLIERTSRLLRERDPLAEIIITTHEKIEVEDVKIHVPQNNCFEIARTHKRDEQEGSKENKRCTKVAHKRKCTNTNYRKHKKFKEVSSCL